MWSRCHRVLLLPPVTGLPAALGTRALSHGRGLQVSEGSWSPWWLSCAPAHRVVPASPVLRVMATCSCSSCGWDTGDWQMGRIPLALCGIRQVFWRGQNHSLFQEEARVDAREGSAGDTSGGLHLQGAPGLSQKQGQSHPYQCLSPASKPCLFLSGSGHALMSVSAAPSPAPRYHFGDLPSQGQTTGCFSLTSTRPPAHLTPLPRPPEGRLMGTEAANPVQVAWLCVLGQQEFGAPSDRELRGGCTLLQGQGDTQPSVSLKK